MRCLPPLSALRAFEAAARHGSFTGAARELAMSQAAVSYQIKRLEAELGATLFVRRNRRVELTPEGGDYGRTVSRAFDLLEQGASRFGGETLLSITTTGSFANLWLAWHVGEFRAAHPDIDVRITASNGMEDLEAGGFDLAIRQGDGDWPSLRAERLFDTLFTPMCSPAFRETLPADPAPSDLLHATRIAPADSWWTIWSADAGIGPAHGGRGLRLSNQTECMAAALAGQGLAILHRFFAHRELRDGRLVCPSPITSTDGGAYWLAYEPARRRDRRVLAFRRWLLAALQAP